MAPKRAGGDGGGAAPAKKAKAAAAAGPIPRSAVPRAVVPAGAKTLTVVSINVAGLRSVLDLEKPPAKRDALAALVAREAPDVLCLNEHKLKASDVDAARAGLAELLPDYGRSHFSCSGPPGKNGYSGVAFLIRDGGAVPADAAVTEGLGVFGEGDAIVESEGRVLTLAMDGLNVIATYVPNSGQKLERLAYRTGEDGWDRKLAKYASGLANPTLVIGDLNCAHGAADFHNAYARPNFAAMAAGEVEVADQYVGLAGPKKQAGLTADERESFASMLEEGDLVDAFRRFHPTATGVFSYCAFTPRPPIFFYAPLRR